MVSLEQQAETLRRQERVLQEALNAGPSGQQRQVQTALLRQTRRELALARRAGRAVDAGWNPFEPAADWPSGYVEDPRFLGGRTRLLSGLAALPLAAAGGAWLALRWEALAAALTAAILLLGLQAALYEVLGRIAHERDRALLRGAEGQPLRIFNAPMPARAAVAYRRARESQLFDTFTVCSPRPADFRSVAAAEAPSLGLLDPVLIGWIGAHSFLVAQWDLAEDLASL